MAVVTLLAVAAERPAPGTTVLWGIFGKLARHVHHLVNKGIDHARKQAEEAQQKLQAQARMLAERANQRRIAQEEAARRRAEEEAARRQAEADRKRQEEEQRQREEEARRKAEEEARAQRLAAEERARAEAAAKAAAEAAAAKEQLYRLNAFGTAEPPHEWAHHDRDWIYQGGPETDSVKHDVFFNQWDDLDDSSADGYHVTEPVDPASSDKWLDDVGGGIY